MAGKIFGYKVCLTDFDDESFTNDSKVLQIIAQQEMQRFAFFMEKMEFEDTNPNVLFNKVLNEIRAEFRKKMN